MCDDMNRSVGPGQWAPWITDPDPDEEPMPPEQFKAFVEGVKDLMADPNRKEPVDPFQQPLYPAPARSLEEALEGMQQHQIKVLMLEYPTMTRERAAEMVALDLPDRTPKPPSSKPRHLMTAEEENEDLLNSILRNHPKLTREEAQW